MKYWLFQNNQVTGPFEPDSLTQSGGFSSDSLVCPEGRKGTEMGDWVRAGVVPELAEALLKAARVPAGGRGPELLPPEPTLRDLAVLGSLQEKTQLLENSVSALQTRLNDELRSHEAELGALRGELTQKEQANADLQAKLNDVEAKLASLSALAGMKDELDRAKELLLAQERQIADLNGKITEAMSRPAAAPALPAATPFSAAPPIEAAAAPAMPEIKIGTLPPGGGHPVEMAPLEIPAPAPAPSLTAGPEPAAALPPAPQPAAAAEPSKVESMLADEPSPLREGPRPEAGLRLSPLKEEPPKPSGMGRMGLLEEAGALAEAAPVRSEPALKPIAEPKPEKAESLIAAPPEKTQAELMAEKMVASMPKPIVSAPASKGGKGKVFVVGVVLVAVGAAGGLYFMGTQEGAEEPQPAATQVAADPSAAPGASAAEDPAAAAPAAGEAAASSEPDMTQVAIEFAKTYKTAGAEKTLGEQLEASHPPTGGLSPWMVEKLADDKFQVNYYASAKKLVYEFSVQPKAKTIEGLNPPATALLKGDGPPPPSVLGDKAKKKRRRGGRAAEAALKAARKAGKKAPASAPALDAAPSEDGGGAEAAAGEPEPADGPAAGESEASEIDDLLLPGVPKPDKKSRRRR